MDAADVVKDLTLAGAAHFHATYVAKKLGISADEAHEKLAALQQQGILEVHFDVICPETERTIKSYKLKEEVPLGEFFIEETGDCEPFELQESDLMVTYSPTSSYTRRLLRNGEHSGRIAAAVGLTVMPLHSKSPTPTRSRMARSPASSWSISLAIAGIVRGSGWAARTRHRTAR